MKKTFVASRREFLRQSAAIGGGLAVGYGPLGAFAQNAGAAAEVTAWASGSNALCRWSKPQR